MVVLAASRSQLDEDAMARAVDAFLETIAEVLARGGEVNFTGFGKFSVAERSARQGVNPQTGEALSIAPARVPRFSAGSALKSAVRDDAAARTPSREPSARTRYRRRSPASRGGGGPLSAPSRSAAERSDRVRRGNGGPRSSPPRPRNGDRAVGQPLTEHGVAGSAEVPREHGERHVNAWVAGRGADGIRRKPLEPKRSYGLCFNVGELRDAGLLEGETAIDESEIPPEGLDTHWSLSSASVELEPDSFPLHIPPAGDSETRRVKVTPRNAREATINVVIQARDEVYRQLTVRLAIAGRADVADELPGAAGVAHDVVHVPARQLGTRPPHEWQTPLQHLKVIVFQDGAYAVGKLGAVPVDQKTDWVGWEAQVKGPITNVRSAAEAFRAKWSPYLDDIQPDELAPLFAAAPNSDRWLWEREPEPADRHKQAWKEAAKSKELKALAHEGYLLYDRFFPAGSDLRSWIEALPVGGKLDVSWASDQRGWVAQVPWALMYMQPGGAVDPRAFLGLRLRLGYTTHPPPKVSLALGDRSQISCGNFLYWGSKEDDETRIEAEWQREQLNDLQRQVFWPAAAGAGVKQELLDALGSPAPPPMPVLYLFCQSSFGQQGADPVLAFDDPAREANSIGRTELGLTSLADRPFVFANACTSAAEAPDMVSELQEGFFRRGSRAFLGTETKVPIQFASRFARIYFHYFYRESDPAPMAAGEALWQTRQFLWHHFQNIGGLFYSYVNQYDLYLASEKELTEMQH